jgi:hypothetical protein
MCNELNIEKIRLSKGRDNQEKQKPATIRGHCRPAAIKVLISLPGITRTGSMGMISAKGVGKARSFGTPNEIMNKGNINPWI